MPKVLKEVVDYSVRDTMFIKGRYTHTIKFSDMSELTSIESHDNPKYIIGEVVKVNGRSECQRFTDRLNKLGINVTLSSNIPWVYLKSVNGIEVKETYAAEHGFTAFFYSMKEKGIVNFSDRKKVFEKVREMLRGNKQ